MNRNRTIALLAMLASCVAAAIGIMALQPRPAVAPAQPVPTPEPTPLPGIAITAGDEEFVRTVEELAQGEFEIDPNREGVSLLYLPEPEAVRAQEGDMVIFTYRPELVAEGAAGVVVSREAAAQAAWDALYTYPTHSTPIRLLTLLQSAAGPSYALYEQLLGEGKLQGKGLYIADAEELSPGEWTTATLEGIPVGLLDTIYAETAELAEEAVAALRAQERNDSVEVICPELSPELVQLMIEDHWSMGAAVGAGHEAAARAMLELAEELDKTGKAEIVELEPVVIYSDDVWALAGQGITDAEEIMRLLSGEG